MIIVDTDQLSDEKCFIGTNLKNGRSYKTQVYKSLNCFQAIKSILDLDKEKGL